MKTMDIIYIIGIAIFTGLGIYYFVEIIKLNKAHIENKKNKKMKTKTKPKDKFDFWLENKKDQHYELNQVSLIEKFNEWLPKKEKDWLEYYGSQQSIVTFLTDKNGLNSVFEQKQLDSIIEVLRPIFLKHLGW